MRWLFIPGYVLGWLITTRIMLSMLFKDHGRLDDDHRFGAAAMGFFWPIAAVVGLLWLAYQYVFMPLVTPSVVRRSERAAARQRAERDARVEAGKLGLPYPPDGAA